jgi:NAD(P)-dependent dehydrogenase (short-subunit alcohol dehydrogenase family)
MTVTERFSLAGTHAVVTGASRGIGRAIALGFAEAGADVALVGRKQASLEEVGRAIESATGRRTLALACHMGEGSAIEAMVDRVLDAWGTIDVLVNNAGTNPVMAPLTELGEAAWDKIMAVNLKGPFLSSAHVIRAMTARGTPGSIINMASVGGLDPSPLLGAYSVSKAALLHLTRALAKECGAAGIRVNAIAPGLIETRFAAALIETPAIHDAVLRQTPLGRHGQPEEIVGAALFLASAASAFMTGQVVVVDGGSRM